MTTRHLLIAKALRVQADELARQWARLCAEDPDLPEPRTPPMANSVIEAFAGVLDDGALANGLDQRATQTVVAFAGQVKSLPVVTRQFQHLGQVLQDGTARAADGAEPSEIKGVVASAVQLGIRVAERHLGTEERAPKPPNGIHTAPSPAWRGNGHRLRPLAHKLDPAPVDLGRRPTTRRRLLVLLDLVTVLVTSYGVMLATRGGVPTTMAKVASVLAYSLTCMALIAFQRLYLARICAVRPLEVARLARVMVLAGLCGLAIDRVFDPYTPAIEVVTRAVVGFVGLAATRGAFRAWLHRSRTREDPAFISPVIIVGTNEEALDLYRLVTLHPEFGYRVQGFIGPPSPSLTELGLEPMADHTQLPTVLDRSKPTGAMVAPSGIPSFPGVNWVVRQLLEGGCHVHLSSGLRGIHHRRITSYPLAYESLLYLEKLSFWAWQRRLKRVMDLVLGGAALVVSSPVIAAAALAIKLQDGGKVIYRQERIGRAGQPFTMLKFRTMEMNADTRLDEVKSMNERDSVLFKAQNDPRITKVGRVLRYTDVDELPQLINVLKGDMSLVGPRPALAEEVVAFKGRDLHVHRYQEGPKAVRPGMTGLWQDKARHNPSFESYERWDGFYVENWSVALDLAILLSTARKVAWRSFAALYKLVTRRGGGAAL